MKIYTVERHYDYEGSSLVHASVSLDACIDAINTHKYWPSVADHIEFAEWDDGKVTGFANIDGYREDLGFITREEVTNGFAEWNKQQGKNK